MTDLQGLSSALIARAPSGAGKITQHTCSGRSQTRAQNLRSLTWTSCASMKRSSRATTPYTRWKTYAH